MEVTVFCSLMPQKYIGLKQKILKKRYPLCLGNISKDVSVDDMKKTGSNGYVYGLVLIVILLILAISSMSINVWWNNMI